MEISIIIPTLNRPEQLIAMLQKLKVHLSDQLEVLVVDDSQDALNEVNFLGWGERLTYIHRGEKLGVSSARNVGASQAKGKYLLFLDDDDAFTETWITDFLNALQTDPDLVFCDMQVIESNGKVLHTSAAKNKQGIVIPGAWLIRKEIFDQVGGYDERLKFAENTELFFRLGKVIKTKKFIEQENFIYKQSADGGSKDLQNMVDSLHIILEKHDEILTRHVKHLYHQNIGVIEMRFTNFQSARKHLFKSWQFKPRRGSTLIRLTLAYIPFLAKKIYTRAIRTL